MTNKSILSTLCLVSLLSLGGCSKENVQIFPDRDCLYTGTLTVHRQPRSDWQLVSYQLTDDETTIEASQLKPLSWRSDEESKVVPIGLHRALYMSETLSHSMTATGVVSVGSDSGNGFKTISPTPLLLGQAEGRVKYDEETVVDVIPKDISKGVKVILTNSSSELVSDIDMTISKGYLDYDCLNGKSMTPSVFKLPGEPFDLSSAGLKSRTGYLFDVVLPMDLHLSFKDQMGSEYFIEFEDAFHRDETNERLYVAELDLSEAGLEKAGVKKTVKAIRIDGRDVTFPSEGGKMTMDVKAYRVTTVYSGGKEVSRDEEEIPYTYTLDGDDALQISYDAPYTFTITADANQSGQIRTKYIRILVDGVTRLFTIKQPAMGSGGGFTVDGEVQ